MAVQSLTRFSVLNVPTCHSCPVGNKQSGLSIRLTSRARTSMIEGSRSQLRAVQPLRQGTDRLNRLTMRSVGTTGSGEGTVTQWGGGSGGDKNSGGGGGGGGGGRGGDGGDASDQPSGKKGIKSSQWFTLIYGAIIVAGGATGYFKSGSKKSLISGVVTGLILLYTFTLLPHDPKRASTIGLLVSLLLSIIMGGRYLNSRRFNPAGSTALLSMFMTAGYLHGIVR
eukprot:jgi/Mesen1/6146/ME000314S05157